MVKAKNRKPKLDSDAIEGMAIRQIETYFERSMSVKTFLEKTDKGPFWDGYLHIYKNETKTNENFVGAIKVQSKGKTVATFSNDNFKYPVRRVDLEAYKKEGTLYFVTQITETEKKLFCRELTPLLISNILRAHKGTQYSSVLMYEVPDDLKLFEERLLVFKKDCEKQITAVATNAKTYTIDDLVSYGINNFSFTVPYRHIQENSLPEYLSSNEVYLYADIDSEHHTIVPIGDAPVKMTFKRMIVENISVGGKVYYYEYENELTRDHIIIRIGGIFEIIIPRDKDLNKMEIRYQKKATSLQGLIKEAEFVLDINKHQSITIGNHTINLIVRKGPHLYEQMLPKWKELDSVLNRLGLQTDIEIENLSKEDGQKLGMLVDIVGRGRKIKLKDFSTCVMNFNVSNINLLLWCYVNGNGECMMGNFFDNVSVKYKFTEDQILPSSIFSYLTSEQWAKVDNICYAKLLKSYQLHIIDNPYIMYMANCDCLNMLRALDDIDTNSNKYEKTANNIREILEWLKKEDGANSITYSLNLIQLNKRLGHISDDEKIWLHSIVDNEEFKAVFRAEASVLLDDYKRCLNLMKRFDLEAAKTFYRDPVSKWFTEEIESDLQKILKSK